MDKRTHLRLRIKDTLVTKREHRALKVGFVRRWDANFPLEPKRSDHLTRVETNQSKLMKRLRQCYGSSVSSTVHARTFANDPCCLSATYAFLSPKPGRLGR